MSDEDGIRKTIAQYCHFCDSGYFDDWADLYTEDAEFRVMGQTHKGRDAIKAFIVNAQPPGRRGKHVTVNSVLEVDGDSARGWTDFIFLNRAPDGGGLTVTTAGRYHDRFTRDGDRWRFAEREIVFMGEEPQGDA